MNLELPRIGESRMEEGIRLRPFTAVFVLVLALAIAGGLVATFVFADTADERWLYGLISLTAAVLSALSLAAVIRREERAPFPLFARRALWLSCVLFVVGAFAFTVIALFVPMPGFRPGVSLYVMAPAAVVAWRLLRNEKRG